MCQACVAYIINDLHMKNDEGSSFARTVGSISSYSVTGGGVQKNKTNITANIMLATRPTFKLDKTDAVASRKLLSHALSRLRLVMAVCEHRQVRFATDARSHAGQSRLWWQRWRIASLSYVMVALRQRRRRRRRLRVRLRPPGFVVRERFVHRMRLFHMRR
jgi:hypothetical protein